MIDSWARRRLLRPWCGLRGHPETFWIQQRINGVPFEDVSRCSCGTKTRRYSLP